MKDLLEYLASEESTTEIGEGIKLDMQTGERTIDESILREIAKAKPFTAEYIPTVYAYDGIDLDASMDYDAIYRVLNSSRLFHSQCSTILSSYIDSLVYNRRTPIVFKFVYNKDKKKLLVNENSPLILDMIHLNVTDEYMTARYTEMLKLEAARLYDDADWLKTDTNKLVFDLPHLKFSPFVFIVHVKHVYDEDNHKVRYGQRWMDLVELKELSEKDTAYNNPITQKILELA